jgi:hypothetical protein
MKAIEQLDNEQAAFTLYRLLESNLGPVDVDEDTVEEELRGSIASALGDRRAAEQISARIAGDDNAAGEAARAALAAIRDGKLFPGAQAELNALLEKPPVSETLDFGASICGIALISLLLTMRFGVKHKRTKATTEGAAETEITASIGSESLTGLAQALWSRLKPH